MYQELEGTLINTAELIAEQTSDEFNYNDFDHKPQINGVELIGNKTSEDLGIDIPTKTSELENDSGFITEADVPTKTSELQNDSGFITSADVPTKTSELQNDSGFITSADVPTKTSDLDNDSGFVTSEDIPTKTSELDNDSGFITGDNYYDKSEIDTALSGKADKSDTYTKSQVDTALSGKADKSDTYTKTETDNKIVGLIDDNSTANNKAWSASKIDGELSDKASTGDLALKADKSNTYTKTQTDSAIVGLIDDTTTANNKAWSSSKITDEIINILPTGTASGSVASFNTSLALPLVSLKADVSATPGGVSEISLTNCGANLCNQADIVSAYPTKYTVDTDGSIKTVGNLGLSDVLWTNKSKVSGVLNVVFVSKYQNAGSVGIRPKIVYTDATSSVIYTTNTQDYSVKTLLTTSGKTVEKIVVDYGTNNPTNFFLEVTLDTSASTYEAYNGNTEVINFGETIYNGGTFTQDNAGHRTLTADGTTTVLPDGTPITALIGTNNIYNDSGNSEVVYKKSINDAIAELQALFLS